MTWVLLGDKLIIGIEFSKKGLAFLGSLQELQDSSVPPEKLGRWTT